MVKLNKIYTRTGDDGSSGLVDGSRSSKAGLRMTAIGEVDEANSFIGVAIAALGDEQYILADRLRLVQNEMFDLGADLATPDGIDGALRITADQVTRIESGIDVMNTDLMPLTSFILPGGSAAVAGLHVARAVVRRLRGVLVVPICTLGCAAIGSSPIGLAAMLISAYSCVRSP